jgi:ankyrin repeat protein
MSQQQSGHRTSNNNNNNNNNSNSGRIPSPKYSKTLYNAIHSSSILDVIRLIEEEKHDVNQTDALGWSPLHHAAFLGHVKVQKNLYSSTKI